jgi:hypothetical protein
MLADWTWSQLAHEGGTFAAAMIALACFIYLAGKGVSVLRKRERELLYQGIGTGLTPQGPHVFRNRRRFGMLDLLVAITFVAALAGLVRGMANEEKDGIPWERGSWWNFEEFKQREE